MRSDIKPFSGYWFLLHADEFYALTRFSYFAFLQNMAFRNAHHTLEYYLKSGIADHLTLDEMRRLGHNLSRLYQKFTELVELVSVDLKIINYINHFNELRYPRNDSFTHICWGMPYKEFFSRFDNLNLQGKVACFCMQDIDSLVHCLRCAIVPDKDSKIIVTTSEHAQFLYRENKFFKPE